MEIFGIPLQAFLGQLMLGLVNGAFYAMLSLGLAVIFGLLDIVNFAHGALYMLGAFAAWIMLDQFGINYWLALMLAPLVSRCARGGHRARLSQAPVRARPAVRAAADLRPGADVRGHVSRAVWRVGPELPGTRTAVRRDQSRLHGPAQLPRLGRPRLAGGLPGHLVPDRAHPAGRLPACRHRERQAGAGLRRQRADDGDAHLRRAARLWRRWPACSPRRSSRSRR